MRVLVTGSCGLIGSEAVKFYDERSEIVVGIDNNMRARFFDLAGDTDWKRIELEEKCCKYRHLFLDIRDRQAIRRSFNEFTPDLIIHCAAQPSHDLAAKIPFVDFEVNALATLNLLEATRQEVPDAVFIFMSTNKVYGDGPNSIRLKELGTRWDYDDCAYCEGISETFPIDHCVHSLFGVSKLSADIMVQEYGRYFGMKTGVFRGSCLTGPAHTGVELHGFLSYLFKVAITEKPYTIYGYKGKQVRDQIHSYDVVRAFDEFYKNPRLGAVYNIGGGKANSISIVEAIGRVQQLLGVKIDYFYTDVNRIGDHICYYTDLRKIMNDFPNWSITFQIDNILTDLASSVI